MVKDPFTSAKLVEKERVTSAGVTYFSQRSKYYQDFISER